MTADRQNHVGWCLGAEISRMNEKRASGESVGDAAGAVIHYPPCYATLRYAATLLQSQPTAPLHSDV